MDGRPPVRVATSFCFPFESRYRQDRSSPSRLLLRFCTASNLVCPPSRRASEALASTRHCYRDAGGVTIRGSVGGAPRYEPSSTVVERSKGWVSTGARLRPRPGAGKPVVLVSTVMQCRSRYRRNRSPCSRASSWFLGCRGVASPPYPQIFFACAGGYTTMVRYLTRIEVGARIDVRDVGGHLPGEFFWGNVTRSRQEEIATVLVAVGWPEPPPRDARKQRGRSLTRRGSHRGISSPSRSRRRRSPSPPRSASARRSSSLCEAGDDSPHDREDEFWGSGKLGVKRLASEMKSLLKLC